MKIAYLTNQYPHPRHTFIRREIVAVEKAGIEVVRFTIRDLNVKLVDPNDEAEYTKTTVLFPNGTKGVARLAGAMLRASLTRFPGWCRAMVRAWRMSWRGGKGVAHHLAWVAEAEVLVERMKTAGVTHVHVHFGTNCAAVALFAKIMGGITYSITMHGPEEWDRSEAISLEDKYNNALFLTPVSEFARCQIFRWYHHTRWHNAHLVRCGVDEIFLGQEPTPVPDVARFVTVAGLVPEKGHLRLLEAVDRLVKAGRTFEAVLVGDGPLRPLIESEIARRGLGGTVKLLGWMSNTGVRDQVRASRAILMPSFAENLPVAIMEALALGRPAIASCIAGIPELVEPGVSGWLVPASSIDDLVTAMSAVLDTPVGRLTEMGRAGRARVIERHNAETEGARMAGLIRELVPRSAQTRPPQPVQR